MDDLSQLDLAPAERSTLSRYGFDAKSFFRLKAELARGEFPAERNRLSAALSPPSPGDFTGWPEDGTAEARACEAAGLKAIQAGEVGVAILNGGMATRFGGMVKCLVEVEGGRTFLEVKLDDVRKAPGRVPIFLMNSFATEADTERFLQRNRWLGLPPDSVHLLAQHVSLRLTPSGELFRDASGKPSLYAPGHGDVFDVLANAKAFHGFVAAGGRTLLVSNVDNLAATLSPKVIGAHLRSGKRLTVEVAPKAAGDAGGAPARVNGHLEIVEGFRFPKSFDQSAIPVFNTNTFIVEASAIRPDYPLTWFRADKKVDDKDVVQFERLMGEATAFEDAAYLAVPREGREGRFLPVKTLEDLERVAGVVAERWPKR